jgi:hypothetical protein
LDDIRVHSLDTGISRTANEQIISQLYAAREHWRHSHEIDGRWENTYVGFQSVDSVRPVFSLAERAARQLAGDRLLIPRRVLGIPFDGYWFNIAEPGEATAPHRHLVDSVLSGVYYLTVPESSGNLRFFGRGGKVLEIDAIEGLMVLFPSHLRHAVGCNRSEEVRISVAFNLYRPPIEVPREEM